MRSWLVALTFCLGVSAARAEEPAYDVVIRHARIVNGSGNPWFHGDVAIRGQRIVAVGRVPAGKAGREIDAHGLVVAPGFIDIHSHSDYLLLEDGNAQSKVRQGVTTEVLGEGTSAGPFKGPLTSPQRSRQARAVGHPGGLFRHPRARRYFGERRQLRGPRQRLAERDGQVLQPALGGTARR